MAKKNKNYCGKEFLRLVINALGQADSLHFHSSKKLPRLPIFPYTIIPIFTTISTVTPTPPMCQLFA